MFTTNDKGMLNLQLAAVDWDHDHWQGEFYPHDLPVQWRLTYYANEYRRVLVPEQYWSDAGLVQADQWYEDVHEAFRFYLSLPAHLFHPSEQLMVLQSLDAFKEKLGGVLLDAAAEDVQELGRLLAGRYPNAELFYRDDSSPKDMLRRWRGMRGRTAAVLDCTNPRDLKTLRMYIERFISQSGADEAAMFIDGDIGNLNDAVTIAQLLGY
ncbi:MAG: DUF72 domain-containing protein [Gammaproteobacteria bacterium]|nr:DUF72 domain-containing protein [Gammaproteobacteria bacterium]